MSLSSHPFVIPLLLIPFISNLFRTVSKYGFLSPIAQQKNSPTLHKLPTSVKLSWNYCENFVWLSVLSGKSPKIERSNPANIILRTFLTLNCCCTPAYILIRSYCALLSTKFLLLYQHTLCITTPFKRILFYPFLAYITTPVFSPRSLCYFHEIMQQFSLRLNCSPEYPETNHIPVSFATTTNLPSST